MPRFLIGLLLLVAGCAPSAAPTRVPDSGSRVLLSGESEPAAKEFSTSADNSPPALTVGSKAPALKVSRFLKGKPVTQFEPGRIYVVEFWATWCGPCVAAMPHVTALQKQYPDVTFIGVNVLEDDDSAAENFLRQKGDVIGYRIARDDIAPGASADDGAMAQTWLKASESNGIPAAFVVDGQGQIANISHPMELDESLPQIIAGTWDYSAAAKNHLESLLEVRREAQFRERFGTLAEAGASTETLAGLDKLAEEFPTRAVLIGFTKFRLLTPSAENAEQALAEGRKLLDGEQAQNLKLLNLIAWDVVNPERKQPASAELQELALEAIRRADDQLEQKHPVIANTLARVLFCTGDVRAAVEAERRALSLAETASAPEELLQEIRQRLREYEQEQSPAKPDSLKAE